MLKKCQRPSDFANNLTRFNLSTRRAIGPPWLFSWNGKLAPIFRRAQKRKGGGNATPFPFKSASGCRPNRTSLQKLTPILPTIPALLSLPFV